MRSGWRSDSQSSTLDVPRLLRGFAGMALLLLWLTMPAAGQVHYRVRADDQHDLNADAGWAEPMDLPATVEAQKKIRIRFEFEHSENQAPPRLQFRRNASAWQDAQAYPEDKPDSAPASPAVWLVPSGQYGDGQETVDLLRGSAANFAVGEGRASPGPLRMPPPGHHSEAEFALIIPTFHDGAGQNRASDVFEFRLSGTTGVASPDSGYARVSLIVPPGLIGGTYVESPNRVGPFRDPNGNLYAILEPAETDNVFMVIKSTDGGKTWSEQDAAHRPATDDLESVDAVLAGDALHIVHHAGKRVVYHRFLVSSHPGSPDRYEIRDEVIAAPITYQEQSVAMEVAPSGAIHCFYARTVGTRGQVFYKVRHTAWGAERNLDEEPGGSFFGVAAVRGIGGKVHVVYAAESGKVYYRSVSAEGTISPRTLLTAETGRRRADRVPIMPPVSWMEQAEEKVMVGYRKAIDGRIYTRILSANGSPGPELAASAHPVSNDQAQSRQPTAHLAADGATVYLLYADAIEEDIYLNVKHSGSGWAGSTKIGPGMEADLLRGFVFNHSSANGGAKVLGYLVDNGSDGYTGTVQYGEYPIPDQPPGLGGQR